MNTLFVNTTGWLYSLMKFGEQIGERVWSYSFYKVTIIIQQWNYSFCEFIPRIICCASHSEIALINSVNWEVIEIWRCCNLGTIICAIVNVMNKLVEVSHLFLGETDIESRVDQFDFGEDAANINHNNCMFKTILHARNKRSCIFYTDRVISKKVKTEIFSKRLITNEKNKKIF